MCGIFSLLNYKHYDLETITKEFMKGQNRGPEFSKLDNTYLQMVLGFHRLAINGLNNESNQPLVFNDIVLICNGEIYNYKFLYESMKVTPVTDSDCEVIIHLYLKYGIEQTLNMLDGVFSFILYDNRITEDLNNKMFIARDPYGVRPLYYIKPTDDNIFTNLYGFASELKCLVEFYNNDTDGYIIKQFEPGTYSILNLSSKVSADWEIEKENIPYFIPTFSYNWVDHKYKYNHISSYLNNAVTKRCLTTERPIACLLSGGLDSSLIAALVNNYYNLNHLPNKLETYSIGLEGSEDLKFARIVADYLGTNHTEIIVTEKEMFEAIPEVIYAIESYDTTTIRASIGNYLLGKYISNHSEAKVIFNGDGSDELFGGYLYMNQCPDDIEFDKETRRLLKEIHTFDVLRSDKSISSNGLEPRTPFLDKGFVNFVLSIPPYVRNHKNINNNYYNGTEKYILRQSFSSEIFTGYDNRQIIPSEILWRKKEAFSDGVCSHGRSLYTILQEQICDKLNTDKKTDLYTPCIDTEKFYYRMIFDEKFPNCSHILPHFWMPKYINATDPSARTLDIYTTSGKP
jgi:asparagine synthase (glutamine-hydrolysing)